MSEDSVACVYHHSPWEALPGGHEFKANLGFLMSLVL